MAGIISEIDDGPSSYEVKVPQRHWILRHFNFKLLGWRLAVLVVVIGSWQLAADRWLPEYLIGRPDHVAQRLWDWASTGVLWSNLGVTFEESAIGFVLGAGGGIIFGVLLGVSGLLGDVLEPYATTLYSLPKIALAPLFVVWFGIGIEMKVVLAATSVFFLVFWSVYTGARSVEQELIHVLRVMGATKWQILCKATVPGLRPWIFNGLRMGMPYAFVGAIVGEIVASNKGLGYLIQYSGSTFDAAGLFAALVVLAFITTLANVLLGQQERRSMRWRKGLDG